MARTDAGAGLTLVHLEPSEAIRASYTRPGQVLVMKGDGEDAYFALASAVSSPSWSLLVRDAGAVARKVLGADLGSELSVAVPRFAGFPYQAGVPGPFGLVAVGSALGAVRGLYLTLEAEGRAHECTIFLGVREGSQVPLRDELERFVRAGGRVVVCISDVPPEPIPPFEVRAGLVQDAVAQAAASGDPRLPPRAVLYVAGPPVMMDDFRGRADELGFMVHTNA